MKRIYDKTVRELAIEFVNQFYDGKANQDYATLSRQEIVAWFSKNYPKIKLGTINAHLLKLSINAPSRIHYGVHDDGSDDILFQINQNIFRKYNRNSDPDPIYINSQTTKADSINNDSIEEKPDTEFAYEKDLQNFLAKNLDRIEDGLTLYKDEEITGIEFPVGGRFIDILALDKNNNYVVIELKVSKGYDRVVGQLLRYMAWIEKNQIDNNQKVRGVIIAKEISEDLVLACSRINDISLFEYELSVKLNKIS